MKPLWKNVSRVLNSFKMKKYFCELVFFFFFLATISGKRVIFVITFDTPASKKDA